MGATVAYTAVCYFAILWCYYFYLLSSCK